ncbi:hypothetical protein [Rhizobium leguminosarum]|uniref:hypothetical protein n=1 Tax=Rhizobium leguminosarum TaxID=384 RepID=UPI001559B2C6|nr:hypothetical protein [Rhizobium leguminosarum]
MEIAAARDRVLYIPSVDFAQATEIEPAFISPDAHATPGSAGSATMLSTPNHALSRTMASALSNCVNNKASRTFGREHAT